MHSIIKIDKSLLRKLQLCELEILKVVASFCERNEIRYCLTSGTLLGAARHGGFIPWDDDIDISMPRKDFEKFLSLASFMPEGYYVQATRINNAYPLCMAKVCKEGTVMKEPVLADLPIKHGVWIDVFPLDKVKNVEHITARSRKISFLSTILYHKLGISTKLKFSSRLLSRIIGMIGINNIDKLRTWFMTQDENKQCQWLTSFASNLGCKNLLFHENVYFPLKKIKFEDEIFYVPNDFETWLKNAYGDYMTLPPENKRVNRHHLCELSL